MRRASTWCGIFLLLTWVSPASGQPETANSGVRFILRQPEAKSVAVVGDFNGWSRSEDSLRAGPDGLWSLTRVLRPGRYQYKFLVDGASYILDPANPATVMNYNSTAENSVFVLTEEGRVRLSAELEPSSLNPNDVYPPSPDRRPVFLNILWHQHQPLYVNPRTDQLTGPWVRTHATKDYYDMAAILKSYPDVHCTINLTSSLLQQLLHYYVERLGPFVDTRAGTIDVEAFWKRWKGKTDPWIDLALKPTAEFDDEDERFLYRNSWNAFGTNEVMIRRFPGYLSLREKLRAHEGPRPFTEQEMRELKFYFYLAQFDPEFLTGPVQLTDGSICDLSGFVERRGDGTYHLRRRVTEEDCRRMVVEAYRVMANVVPVHRALRYSPETGKGQIDVITTPYYHPILPLIYDSDLARQCQPGDRLPPRFSYPDDARAQVVKAVKFYRETFGTAPLGMWPGEGSLAQPVLEILRENGIIWSATDVKNLVRSDPPGRPNSTPYTFPAGKERTALVFRDTELSDRIGFKYQDLPGEEAAEDFVRSILARAPATNEPDVLVTVILDGENAWEWYRQDEDGKTFLNALYRKLTVLFHQGRVITTTMSEYLHGNPSRGVPAHGFDRLPGMDALWPGSWINANFDTWIGEEEENRAWEYLLQARKDLASSGIPRPDPAADPPPADSALHAPYKAWEAMYAAEGSDWFWWYGSDQEAPGGDHPFEEAFFEHLRNVYAFANRAGARLTEPEFPPILGTATPSGARTSEGGTMARASEGEREVFFLCDARGISVPGQLFVAGSHPALGSWRPNTVAMRDDGKGGDARAGDGIWTFRAMLPADEVVQYKYTNSGAPGVWTPGEEFASRNRSVRIPPGSGPHIIKDTFGKTE
jgi:alpha-amylase/alpha-mannosidase (GH57 family)